MADNQKILKGVFTPKKQLRISNEQLRQEMYKRNLELAENNQMLSLLRSIDNLVLETHESLQMLCQQIAKVITDNSNFPFVAFLSNTALAQEFKVLGLSSAVHQISLEQAGHITFDLNEPWLKGEEKLVELDLKSISSETIGKHLHSAKALITALNHDLHITSLIIIKLIARQRLVGLMVVGFGSHSVNIAEKNHALLDRISEAVGVALDNNLLFEENQKVLRKIQQSNVKLKALDAAKDEFISMASHQLRTPLTSVKGYLSMVLEGDAGNVTKQQKLMLDQAFVSSQRMVYLIADFLNVSRLKTGKFIIEPKPTFLPDLVAGELDQLYTTAKAKNLELSFDKPKTFPSLNLDETKTRQVVMNFVDNALHYTPEGGHVKVALDATDHAINFTVSDDGIGVPKNDQRHLFSKFYRAGNARKARPDGTGLGLFMAKKVIIAQGGAIIVNSQEGKGSTFGFTFPRAKLETPK